jgi:hypothetical protein
VDTKHELGASANGKKKMGRYVLHNEADGGKRVHPAPSPSLRSSLTHVYRSPDSHNKSVEIGETERSSVCVSVSDTDVSSPLSPLPSPLDTTFQRVRHVTGLWTRPVDR